MEWTPEKAVETDLKVRSELQHSRAGLIQFVADGAWRLLPEGYRTAAAYVQEAAGVKRSEAYRLVATARASQMILARFVQESDNELDERAYQWIVNDVIKSSHTGEHLCSIIHELTVDIESRAGSGVTVYDAIAQSIAAHPRPSGDSDEDSTPVGGQSPDGSADGEASGGGAADDSPRFPDVESLEKAQRIIICPNCQTPLR